MMQPQAMRRGRGGLWLPERGVILPPGHGRRHPWEWAPPPLVEAAPTISAVTAGGQASSTTGTTAAFSASASEIMWLYVTSYDLDVSYGTDPGEPTVSSWTKVEHEYTRYAGFPDVGLTLFRRVGPFSSATQAIVFGAGQDYIKWQVVKSDGTPVTGTNGSDAQAQVVKASNTSNLSSVTGTFASTPTTGNAFLACSCNWDAVAITVRSGFTEAYNDVDVNIATMATAYRASGTDTAVSHSMNSGTGYNAIIGVEIVALAQSLVPSRGGRTPHAILAR